MLAFKSFYISILIMKTEEVVELVESYFRDLTGKDPVYETHHPRTGKSAHVSGSVLNSDWQVTLTRQFGDERVYEQVPTGDISSLELLSVQRLPNEEGVPKANVFTKLDYLYAVEKDKSYVDNMIKKAISSQKAMKETIENQEANFRVLPLLTASEDIIANKIDGTQISAYIKYVNEKKVLAEEFVLVEKIGDPGNKSEVKAGALLDNRMTYVIPQLDFQIEKFEGLLEA